jgi:hypothetical protein
MDGEDGRIVSSEADRPGIPAKLEAGTVEAQGENAEAPSDMNAASHALLTATLEGLPRAAL